MVKEQYSGPWKVGELAKITGITVKALHHYDKIGLLRPSYRTDGGHRFYSHQELEKLHQIVVLKHLGLSLEQVQEAIYRPDFSPLQTLKELREEFKRRRLELEDLEGRLKGVEKAFCSEGGISSRNLIEIIERITMLEKYLTKEQLKKVEEIEKSLTPERIEQLTKVEWPTLIAEVQNEMEHGTPPSDAKVHQLAQRWMKLVSEKTKGDPELAKSYRKIIENEPSFAKNVTTTLGRPGVNLPKLMDYMRDALEASRTV